MVHDRNVLIGQISTADSLTFTRTFGTPHVSASRTNMLRTIVRLLLVVSEILDLEIQEKVDYKAPLVFMQNNFAAFIVINVKNYCRSPCCQITCQH